MSDEADALIEGYKQVLVAEAELARGDLDEIEDHLRALTGELRATGMPRVAAVREACRRLGDPRAVAREHARVRSPFGARLSKLRAYSAVALMLPMLVDNFRLIPRVGLFSSIAIEGALGAVVALALALRLTWARPIVLGAVACFAVQCTFALFWMPHPEPFWLLLHLGTFAFVMPWRRSELTTSGLALALQVWTFGVTGFALQFQVTSHHGFPVAASGAILAYLASVIATTGIILRARWAAIASLAAALGLVMTFVDLAPLQFPHWQGARPLILAHIASATVAALVAAGLAWRNARSTLGTLAHVL